MTWNRTHWIIKLCETYDFICIEALIIFLLEREISCSGLYKVIGAVCCVVFCFGDSREIFRTLVVRVGLLWKRPEGCRFYFLEGACKFEVKMGLKFVVTNFLAICALIQSDGVGTTYIFIICKNTPYKYTRHSTCFCCQKFRHVARSLKGGSYCR